MGTLKPGATYIYERVDGVTYSREAGADPNTRVPIGWDHKTIKHDRETFTASIEARLWRDIRTTAKSVPALQKVLDHAILLYHLSKDKA